MAVEFAHGLHQLQDAGIIDTIVDKIRIFPVANNALVTKNGKVLGDIGVGGLYLFANIPYGHLLVLKKTENLKPDRMRHGFEHASNGFNLVVFQNRTLVFNLFL